MFLYLTPKKIIFMKKVLIIFIVAILTITKSFTQNEIGVKLGLSSYNFPANSFTNSKKLKLSIEDASYGFQAGIFARIGLFGLYIQPEVDFNSNTVRYRIQDLDNIDTLNSIRTSTYRNIDIPVLFMINPSIFRFYAGPVGHYLIDDISDFTKKDRIKEILNNLKYGYQAGVGISVKSVTFDVRYEDSFNKSIKTFEIDGKEFTLDDSESRFIFSIWFRF